MKETKNKAIDRLFVQRHLHQPHFCSTLFASTTLLFEAKFWKNRETTEEQ